jgi:hypothetical protein
MPRNSLHASLHSGMIGPVLIAIVFQSWRFSRDKDNFRVILCSNQNTPSFSAYCIRIPTGWCNGNVWQLYSGDTWFGSQPATLFECFDGISWALHDSTRHLKGDWGMKLTTHLHLASKLVMRGTVPPLYICLHVMVYKPRDNFIFTYLKGGHDRKIPNSYSS